MHVYVHMYMSIHVYMNLCMYVCMYVCIHTNIYIYIYIYPTDSSSFDLFLLIAATLAPLCWFFPFSYCFVLFSIVLHYIVLVYAIVSVNAMLGYEKLRTNLTCIYMYVCLCMHAKVHMYMYVMAYFAIVLYWYWCMQ